MSFLDTASEIMPIALKYIGKDPHSKSADDYKAAGEMLKVIRPYVTRFLGFGLGLHRPDGQRPGCARWWAGRGDIMIAKDKSAKAKKPQQLEVLLPKMGGLLFFDVMAIPADAKHPENAHKWINYIMKPEVHASLTKLGLLRQPEQGSAEVRQARAGQGPRGVPGRGRPRQHDPARTPDQATRKLLTRTFTNFKAGR